MGTDGFGESVSPATIDRLLSSYKASVGSRGRCGTRPGTLLRRDIPVRTEHWDVAGPGWVEADTVAHCGEFLYWQLRDYFLEREKPVAFTRSRPYRKNDNARVEQKNWTHVRQLVGYGRMGALQPYPCRWRRGRMDSPPEPGSFWRPTQLPHRFLSPERISGRRIRDLPTENAHGLAQLRVIRANNRWDDFWKAAA